jgi:hypothetical protein
MFKNVDPSLYITKPLRLYLPLVLNCLLGAIGEVSGIIDITISVR